MFTIEDYKEAYEFRIFGEEYLKHRHFLIINSFVYVKLFVKPGWVNKETGKRSDPRIQFNSFEQLQDVMDKQSRKLTIQLDIATLTNEKVLNLKETIRNNKGEKQLSFIVYEMQEKLKVTMISRTEKINITNEFLDLLKEKGVKYKMN